METTRTQPIAVKDVVADLAAPPTSGSPLDRELQIGGPDVTTYGGMIDELAEALDRRPPLRVTVPVLTPALSSLWVGLVTPVDTGVARPLIEGLWRRRPWSPTRAGWKRSRPRADPAPTALREAARGVPRSFIKLLCTNWKTLGTLIPTREGEGVELGRGFNR